MRSLSARLKSKCKINRKGILIQCASSACHCRILQHPLSCAFHSNILILRFFFTYPLTAEVIAIPQLTSQPFSSSFLCSPLPCPFPDVVFPPLFLSALSSFPFHCAFVRWFWLDLRTGDMSTPLQSVPLYDGQEVFVWSDCLLDLGTDFLVDNISTQRNLI